MDLPPELVRAVMCHLPIDENLRHVRAACRMLQDILDDPSFARGHIRTLMARDKGTAWNWPNNSQLSNRDSNLWEWLYNREIRHHRWRNLPLAYQAAILTCICETDDSSGVVGFDGIIDYRFWSLSPKRANDVVRKLLMIPNFDISCQQNRLFRWTCRFGDLDIVEELMKDPRVDITDNNHSSLTAAVSSNNIRVVQHLLKDDRLDPAAEYNQALISSARVGYFKVTQMLLDDLRVRPTLDEKRFIFLQAARKRDKDIIRLFLADHDFDPFFGHASPLIFGIEQFGSEIFRIIIQESQINCGLNDNEAIIYAASMGYFSVSTCLSYVFTVTEFSFQMLSILLNQPTCDPSAQSNRAIYVACSEGHVECAKILLDDPRVDPKARDCLGQAVKQGHGYIVKLLLRDERISPKFLTIDNFYELVARAEAEAEEARKDGSRPGRYYATLRTLAADEHLKPLLPAEDSRRLDRVIALGRRKKKAGVNSWELAGKSI
ncbi:hypothetical protein HDU84_008898 [Entophlyctis sp. JEL0112]|nr:hypothetical protein HDU84_008898 [Entophlyctis sp. JEL0112]